MDIRERKDLLALDDGGVVGCKSAAAMVQESEGTIVAMVSTPSVDSYGDVIVQGKNEKGAGWVLDRFNGAPVMLWSHNMYGMNISAPNTRAQVLPHEQHGEALYLDPVMFDPGDEFAMEIEGKIRRGVIVENSVGFTSSKHEYIRDDNDRITGIKFYEQELLELSWANRGANPDTTTLFRSMLLMNGDLAAKVSTEDNHAAEVEKAEMMDALDQVLDRVRELEEVIFNQSAKIKELTDTVQAERVMLARYELTNQVDELLRKLNK
jgi:phage head maturation protease/uncharacterized coiled-coil protein SlyX